MPSIAVIKWGGTDEQRNAITERYLEGGIDGLLEGRASESVSSFEKELRVADREETDQAGQADAGRDAGADGTRRGSSIASGARTVASSVEGLTDSVANLSRNPPSGGVC
jgi:hypothetical protein